jgi:hypothetical protein
MLKDPANMSEEEIDRILSSVDAKNDLPDPSTLSEEQIDRMIAQAQINPQEATSIGPGGMYQGMGESLSEGFDWLVGAAEKAPERWRAWKQMPTSERVKTLGAGALEGLLGVGAGASHGMASLVDYLAGTELAKDTPYIHLPESAQRLMRASPVAAGASKIGGESLGLSAMGLGGIAGAGEKLAGKFGLSGLPGYLSRASTQSAAGGLGGAVLQPDKDFTQAFIDNALLTAKIHGGAAAVKHFGPKVFKKAIGANATPEEMQRNISAAENIGVDDIVPIGAITESPHAKSLSSLNAALPGSGQAKDFMETGKAIDKTVVDYMKETMPEGLTRTKAQKGFVNSLKDAKKRIDKQSAANYEDVINTAKNNNIKFNKNESYKASETIKNNIKDRALKDDEDLQEILTKINKEEKSPIFGTRLKTESDFKEGFDLQKRINEMIGDLPADGKQLKEKQLNIAKKAIESDLKNSSEQSEAVFNKLKAADKYHIDEVLPFRRPEIRKFITKDVVKRAYPDTFVGSFVKKDNRNELLNSVAKHLSTDEKEQLANIYLNKLTREIGGKEEYKTGRILNAFRELPDDTKQMLFSPKNKKSLESALIVKNIMGMDLHQMLNPQTGNVGKKIAGWLAVGVPSAGAGTAAGMGGAGLIAGLGASAKGALLPIAAGQALRRSMRSKSFRNWLTKQPESYKRNFYKALPFVPGYGEENER